MSHAYRGAEVLVRIETILLVLKEGRSNNNNVNAANMNAYALQLFHEAVQVHNDRVTDPCPVSGVVPANVKHIIFKVSHLFSRLQDGSSFTDDITAVLSELKSLWAYRG